MFVSRNIMSGKDDLVPNISKIPSYCGTLSLTRHQKDPKGQKLILAFRNSCLHLIDRSNNRRPLFHRLYNLERVIDHRGSILNHTFDDGKSG